MNARSPQHMRSVFCLFTIMSTGLLACSSSPLTEPKAPTLLPPPSLPVGMPVTTDLAATPDVFIIDPDSSAVEGTGFWSSTAWWESSSTSGSYGSTYRVATMASVSDPAMYWWNEPETTCRTLSAWWTADNNRTSAATYLVLDDDGREVDRFTVDQTTDGDRWNLLGDVSLPAGRVTVALSRWGRTSEVVVADALEVAPCGTSDSGDSGDTPDDPIEPWLSFTSPAAGSTVDNPVTFSLTGEGVESIRLSADGWEMASWEVATSGWQTTYSFSDTGRPRLVVAEGFGAAGELVASTDITVTPEDPSSGLEDVPYFYQYDNYYEPGATCGLTSTAMVLEYWSNRGLVPDDLYERYGKAQAQSPQGIAQLLAWEGLDTTWTTSGTRAEIRSWLDSGRPVIVHGYWTGAGHIAVLIGYDDRDWIAHDPAGDWEVCYGCGGGEGVRYMRGGAWDQRMSYDGDIWFSVSDASGL